MPAYIPHGNCLGFFYLIWVEIMPRMSVVGGQSELAKPPCIEMPNSGSLCLRCLRCLLHHPAGSGTLMTGAPLDLGL